jgi:hypothetical protein
MGVGVVEHMPTEPATHARSSCMFAHVAAWAAERTAAAVRTTRERRLASHARLDVLRIISPRASRLPCRPAGRWAAATCSDPGRLPSPAPGKYPSNHWVLKDTTVGKFAGTSAPRLTRFYPGNAHVSGLSI